MVETAEHPPATTKTPGLRESLGGFCERLTGIRDAFSRHAGVLVTALTVGREGMSLDPEEYVAQKAAAREARRTEKAEQRALRDELQLKFYNTVTISSKKDKPSYNEFMRHELGLRTSNEISTEAAAAKAAENKNFFHIASELNVERQGLTAEKNKRLDRARQVSRELTAQRHDATNRLRAELRAGRISKDEFTSTLDAMLEAHLAEAANALDGESLASFKLDTKATWQDKSRRLKTLTADQDGLRKEKIGRIDRAAKKRKAGIAH